MIRTKSANRSRIPSSTSNIENRTSNITRSGFTLVELLVVIGIIAILISLLLPSLARARQHANTAAGLSNLRSIGQALNMYCGNNAGMLPIGQITIKKNTTGQDYDYGTYWPLLLKKYLGKDADENVYTADANLVPKVFRDPSAAIDAGRIHYSSNPLLMPDWNRTGGGRTFTVPFKLSKIRNNSEIAVIWDGVQCVNKGFDAEYPSWTVDGQSLHFGLGGYIRPGNLADRNPIGGQTIDAVVAQAYPPGGDLRWRQLNNKAANLLFCDGHAETRRRGSVLRTNIWLQRP